MINKQFFQKYQKPILWFANTKIGRWFLRVEKMGHRIPEGKKIERITPNAIRYVEKYDKKGKTVYREQFFSRNEYAMELGKLLFWLPTVAKSSGRYDWIMRPAWQLSLISLLWFIGSKTPSLIPLWFLTTTPFYPDANPESTSVDGYVEAYGETKNWDAAHDAATGWNAYDSAATAAAGSIDGGGGYVGIQRLFFLFDTSALTSSAIISSATLGLYLVTVYDQDNDGDDWINVLQSSPATNTALITADYDQCGAIDNPTEGATRIDLGNITINQYTNFTLNATGLSWISKTAISKFGVREGHDCIDSPITLNPSILTNQITSDMADNGSNKPTLSVTYTSPQNYTKTLTDTVITNSFALKSTSRSLAEIVSIATPIYSNLLNAVRTEILKITEDFSKLGTFLKECLESIPIVGNLLNKSINTFTETLKVGEEKIVSITKLLLEIVSIGFNKLSAITRSFTETIVVTSNRISKNIREFIEAVLVNHKWQFREEIFFNISKLATETIKVVSNRINESTRVFSEILTVAGNIANKGIKIFTETIVVSIVSFTRSLGRIFTELFSVADLTVNKILTAYKTLTETVKVAVNYISIGVFYKVLEETVVALDNLTRLTGRTFAEVLNVLDKIIFASSYFFEETIAIASNLGNQVSRLFGEIVSVGTSLVKQSGKLLEEIVSVAGAMGSFVIGKLLKSALIVNSRKETYRAFVYVENVIIRLVFMPFAISKQLIERIIGRDTFLNSKRQYTVLSDSFKVGLLFTKTIARLFRETVRLASDVIIRYLGRTLNEVVYVSKKQGEYLNLLYGRILSEIVNIVEIFGSFTIGKLLPEIIKVFDVIAKDSAWVMTETVKVIGILVSFSTRVFTETIKVISALLTVLTSYRVFTQILKVIDTRLQEKTQYRILTDHLKVVLTFTRRLGRSLFETVVAVSSMGGFVIGKLLREIVVVAGAVFHLTARVFEETLEVLDAITLLTAKVLVDTVAVIDAMGNWAIGKLFILKVKIGQYTENVWTLGRHRKYWF